MATINRKAREYRDLSLLFSAHPITKDVLKKTNEEAIKASVRNLISTKNYERPFHPEIGCQLYGLLFENFDPITVQIIKQTIRNTLNTFEPRISVDAIDINDESDNNGFEVTIHFRINNSVNPIVLTTYLSRVR